MLSKFLLIRCVLSTRIKLTLNSRLRKKLLDIKGCFYVIVRIKELADVCRKMVKKVILVLCMLSVTITQMYSNAFAIQIETNSPSSTQINSSHVMHTLGNVEVSAVSNTHHGQLVAESNTTCSTMQSGGAHSCAEMTDCAQMQCVSPIVCGPFNCLFNLKSSITAQIVVNDLLLTPNSGSLYRPPITH